jgi:antitoxin CcdA
MPAKKAVNVSLDETVLATARAGGMNLSALLERSVLAEAKEQEIAQWRRDNADAIREANEELERNGLWSEPYRLW